MKKSWLLFLFVTCFIFPQLNADDKDSNYTSDVFVLDQIDRVIISAADKPGKQPDEKASPRQTTIITSRQLQLPDLAGRTMHPEAKRDEVTRMSLYSMYGNRFGIMQAEEDVEKYFNMIAQSNNLKPDEFRRVFTSAGRTEDEGKNEIADTYRAKAVMQMKVGEGIIVSRRKVENYWKEHPELQEPTYEIQYALVPFSTVKNKVEQKTELQNYAKTGFGVLGVPWTDSFWVTKSEVAQEKAFIFDLKADEISSPEEVVNGFELYRMKEIKNPTLQDRYEDIVAMLQQPIIEERQKEFEEKELFEKAAIIDLTVVA